MPPAGQDGQRADVRVDRLSIRVAGLDEDAARELARLVALGLAADVVRTAPSAGLDHLSVSVTTADTKPDVLARRIVVGLWRAMEREVIP